MNLSSNEIVPNEMFPKIITASNRKSMNVRDILGMGKSSWRFSH